MRERGPLVPRPALLDRWNRVYLHHALDGEDPVTALRRADKWADQDLGAQYYDVRCDERLSEDVRARLAVALATERPAPV